MVLGLGDGTFGPPCFYDCPNGPTFLAMGDLNGDQLPDIVTANEASDDVAVFLGVGLGAFSAATHIGVGDHPMSVAIADFNGDQVPDLISALRDADSMALLLGRGNGSFGAPSYFAVGDGPIALAVNDYNGDRLLDVALANTGSRDVAVLLGNADGSFDPACFYGVGSSLSSMASGDFNGDEAQDVVLATGGAARILLGAGDGTFGPASSTAATGRFLDTGDLNGDGTLDLGLMGESICIALGRGDGTFEAPVYYAAGTDPFCLAVGDLNGDENADVVGANMHEVHASVLLGNGDGTLAQAPTFGPGHWITSLVAGDLNVDRIPDLALANESTDNVTVFLGQGGGLFGPAANFHAGDRPACIATSDLDGDGVPDLAVANEGSDDVAVLLGLGDGTFAAASVSDVGDAPVSLACADFNGDLVPDLAVANSGSDNVAVLLGRGDGTLMPADFYYAGDLPIGVAAGDLNDDAAPDLVLANRSSRDLAILLGTGDGSFSGASFLRLLPDWPLTVTIGNLNADFNGDRVPDLAALVYLTHPSHYGAVAIFLGTGDGTFDAPAYYTVGVIEMTPTSVITSDFNGDQVPDLAVASPYSGNVSVLLGQGDGSFTHAGGYGACFYAHALATDDLNADGAPDLVAGGLSSVAVLLGVNATAGVEWSSRDRMPGEDLLVMPSPVGSRATVRFTLPRPSHAHLGIYDVTGRLIESLYDRPASGGPHSLSWHVPGEGAARRASGVYFITLSANGRTTTRRVSVLR